MAGKVGAGEWFNPEVSDAFTIRVQRYINIHNGLHSPVLATDMSGNVVWRRAYEPFGKEFENEDPITVNDATISLTFLGREFDNDLGLYQLGARWYDPELGRFISADPIPSSLNQYAYAGNNPFRGQDRNGTQMEIIQYGFPDFYYTYICPGCKESEEKLKQLANTPILQGTHTYLKKQAAESAKSAGIAREHGFNEAADAYGQAAAVSALLDLQLPSTVGEAYGQAVLLGIGFLGKGAAAAEGVVAKEEKGILANKKIGDAFRDEIADLFRKMGYNVETEVYKWTPFGKRYIDIEVSKGGNILGGIETKVGTGRYNPSQRAKDTYLKYVYGYYVDLVTK